MKKKIFKIILITVMSLFLVICVFTGADIIKSRQLILNQAEDSLGYMSENCADEFTSIFNNAELIVNNASAVAEETLLVRDFAEDNANGEASMSKFKAMLKKITGNSEYPISVYAMFNPNYIVDDAWYLKNTRGDIEDLSASESEMEEWLKEWNDEKSEFKDFYNDTVEAGQIWFETVYDPDIKWEVVTKTRAVYDKEGMLIGLIGVDIYLGDISEKLEEMDNKTGGISAVENSEGALIAGKKISNNSKYIIASTDIGDMWKVRIAQPVKVATASIRSTIFITIFLALAVFLLIVLLGATLYKRHGAPIIKEFEEKDIILINQSRQAQLGEMVGNVAHQLKQPLNGVNMALSNIKEEYAGQLPPEMQESFNDRISLMKKRLSTMSVTVDDFIQFLRPQKEKTIFSAKKEIVNIEEMMRESIHIDMIKIEIWGEDFNIYGYRNEFGQCIFNILDNAREAVLSKERKYIMIEMAVEKRDGEQKEGIITISNNGGRIEGSVERIFELYYTTKEEIGGTGIGLYITKGIIEKQFGGKIQCENIDDGVKFTITIPLNESEGIQDE